LGRAVNPVTAGAVLLLNYEMDHYQLREWYDDMGVDEDETRFRSANLFGAPNPFMFPTRRAAFARQMLHKGPVECLIVDTFTRAYTDPDQNDSGKVSYWLNMLEEFARSMVGASDVFLTAHAGWMDSHARGASALEDWPSSVIRLTKDADEQRYISAMGRDVEMTETRLLWDRATRTMTLGEGSRAQVAVARRAEELLSAAVEIVANAPWANGAAIELAMSEAGTPFQRGGPGDRSRVLKAGVDQGLLIVKDGPRGAKLYHCAGAHLPDPPDHPLTIPGGILPPPSPPSSLKGEGGGWRVENHEAPGDGREGQNALDEVVAG
jgi:hypothetical protein